MAASMPLMMPTVKREMSLESIRTDPNEPADQDHDPKKPPELIDLSDDNTEYIRLSNTGRVVRKGHVFDVVREAYAGILTRQAVAAVFDTALKQKLKDYTIVVRATKKNEFFDNDRKVWSKLLGQARRALAEEADEAKALRDKFSRPEEISHYTKFIFEPRRRRLKAVEDDIVLRSKLLRDLNKYFDDIEAQKSMS